MTRKEEILQAVNNYKNHFPDGFINEHVYVDGAEWADETMIEKACVKLKKLMYDNLMFQGRLHREEVIDNFIEDFKDYMKGE